MRVSLHCQGCAGKVKKHIAKMDGKTDYSWLKGRMKKTLIILSVVVGVTSFSVDLESKRVTVKGHVSPESVLESVSKVKKAEFWPSNPPAKP